MGHICQAGQEGQGCHFYPLLHLDRGVQAYLEGLVCYTLGDPWDLLTFKKKVSHDQLKSMLLREDTTLMFEN